MPATQKTALVGRPRIHANRAAKQKAYRENRAKDAERLAALAQLAVDIAHQVSRAATAGNHHAQQITGFCADETLANLLEDWRQRADHLLKAAAQAEQQQKVQRR